MPRGAGGELPSTLTGAAVAVADKLDTLVGIFGIGMLPTGSKDPYALRRAALGVLRILIEKQLDLNPVEAVNFAIGQFGTQVKSAGLADQVLEFIFDRLRARYEDEGVDVAAYLSVRAVQPGSALDFDQRVQAVQAFRTLPEAEALAAANKRVSNLLAKFEAKLPEAVEPRWFDNATEFSLYSALQQAEQAVQPLAAARQYRGTGASGAPAWSGGRLLRGGAGQCRRRFGTRQPLRLAGPAERIVPWRCRYFRTWLSP